MGQKFQIRSKIPIKIRDILSPGLLFANCAIFGVSERKIGNSSLYRGDLARRIDL